jgi:hypothetical protein
MSETLQEKQEYLRQEIMEQGYDGNAFFVFISSIRGEEEVDLDSWSFEDLKSVVAQFKSQYNQNQNEVNQESAEEQGQNNSNEPPQQNQEMEEKKEVEKKPTSENDFPNDLLDPLYKVMKTEKMVPNEISDKRNLFITISNPQKVKQGLLSMAYYQYDMQTEPMGYKVVRKVNDFTFLYETLPLFNCAVFNPILPHFEFGLKDDSPKKMLYIQNYMNSLVENIFFRTLPIIYEFLTLPQVKWNSKRMEYAKMKTLPISKMPTLEGELIVNINKEEDAKALKIKEEINKKTEALDSINSTVDEILICFDKLNILYKNLGKALLDLEKVYQSNETMNGFFNRLKTLSVIWSDDYPKIKEVFKDDFKYFFKYMNKENVSYLKKFEEFRVTREDYKKNYEKIKRLQIRQPKDLETIKTLRVEYGLQLLMVNDEYKKLIERQAYRCMVQFMKYNENQNTILKDYENCRKLFIINQQQENPEESGENQNQEQ